MPERDECSTRTHLLPWCEAMLSLSAPEALSMLCLLCMLSTLCLLCLLQARAAPDHPAGAGG